MDRNGEGSPKKEKRLFTLYSWAGCSNFELRNPAASFSGYLRGKLPKLAKQGFFSTKIALPKIGRQGRWEMGESHRTDNYQRWPRLKIPCPKHGCGGIFLKASHTDPSLMIAKLGAYFRKSKLGFLVPHSVQAKVSGKRKARGPGNGHWLDHWGHCYF